MDGLDQWRKEIEDALTVMGGLQARQGRALREHSEWLEEHERAMRATTVRWHSSTSASRNW